MPYMKQNLKLKSYFKAHKNDSNVWKVIFNKENQQTDFWSVFFTAWRRCFESFLNLFFWLRLFKNNYSKLVCIHQESSFSKEYTFCHDTPGKNRDFSYLHSLEICPKICSLLSNDYRE